jgi:hypothetical protein
MQLERRTNIACKPTHRYSGLGILERLLVYNYGPASAMLYVKGPLKRRSKNGNVLLEGHRQVINLLLLDGEARSGNTALHHESILLMYVFTLRRERT